MGLLDKVQAAQGTMQAARDTMRERADAAVGRTQAKADAAALKAAQHVSGSFEGVAYRAGEFHVKGKVYPMAECTMAIEQGTDVRARGFSLATGMIGSGKLKGHMRLHIVTPDGEQVVEFKADKAGNAEEFVSKFTKAANLLKGDR